jgi:hypothetical protein
MNRPHLDAQPLQREDGRGIPDMAVGDVGLDGEEVHTGRMPPRHFARQPDLVIEIINIILCPHPESL